MSVFRMRSQRGAFTLLEVMVAVMIVSVVIVALLEMQGNSGHIFLTLAEKKRVNTYASLLLGSTYGYEKSRISLDELVSEFEVEDTLRRELQREHVALSYKTTAPTQGAETLPFEIGETSMRFADTSVRLLRIRAK